MKHSVVFKFLAIMLCALCLTSTIGSAMGIIVLTQQGLYTKTVDQVIEERIQGQASYVSRNLAARYASINLGGSSEDLAWQRFPDQVDVFQGYGYALMDAEGNILESQLPEGKSYKTYTFPVTGQYAHQISLMSEAEKYPSRQTDPSAYTQAYTEGELYVYTAVPPEGAVVSYIHFVLSNCADYSYGNHNSALGVVHYDSEGNLVFLMTDVYDHIPTNQNITYICMVDTDGELLYEASDPTSVGYFTNSGSNVAFYSTLASSVQPLPESTEPVVTETVAETVPETTPIETTAVEETTISTEATEAIEATEAQAETEALEETQAQETVPSSASAPPEETGAQETQIQETTVSTEPPATEAATEPPATEAATEPPATVETLPAVTEPITINGKSLDEFEINSTTYYSGDDQQTMYAEYVYVTMPEYTVELYLEEDNMLNTEIFEVLRIVRHFRQYLLPILAASILLFVTFSVYLCCAAGHKPKTAEIRAGGLNRIPLDLYLVLAGSAVTGLVIGGVEGGLWLMEQDITIGCACAAGCIFAACLVAVGFLYACIAQGKTPGGFWWRNTLCGHCIRWFMKFALWLDAWLSQKCLPFCGRLIKRLWNLTKNAAVRLYRLIEKACLWTGSQLGRVSRWIGRKLHRFLTLLPLTWQWLLVGFCLIIVLIIGIDGFKDGNDLSLPISLLLSFATVLYVAHCYGVLAESTRRMSKGDLDTKVDDKRMLGCFKESAADLNALADVAVVAAQKQLKSERMKTELITNVSHDIKTPLTSIINYVDLLQKPHTDEEEAQYLEVLDRQSLRLKKLIEDLMDMSKASTGNMVVEITQVDAVESINQALGEFADKLDKAHLVPVFRHTEPSAAMMADGKLVWRVLSNLLGNAVKYAMPGTRLYVDLSQVEDKVVISLKNISREELNVEPEELMERFVRGDDSRNTEGSGLGLNIAKSLMELQKGQLQLLVDGDLFKVTLIFPKA